MVSENLQGSSCGNRQYDLHFTTRRVERTDDQHNARENGEDLETRELASPLQGGEPRKHTKATIDSQSSAPTRAFINLRALNRSIADPMHKTGKRMPMA